MLLHAVSEKQPDQSFQEVILKFPQVVVGVDDAREHISGIRVYANCKGSTRGEGIAPMQVKTLGEAKPLWTLKGSFEHLIHSPCLHCVARCLLQLQTL